MVKKGINKYNKSSLIYDSKFSFNRYSNIHKYNDISFEPKNNRLILFYYELTEFKNLNPQKKKKTEKNKVYNTTAILQNECLKKYFDKGIVTITGVEKEKIDKKFDPINSFLKGHDYKYMG